MILITYPLCIGCKLVLKDRRSLRCRKCNNIFKTKHPRKFCVDCKNKLSRNAQFRCLKCFYKFNKGIHASGFKHGKTLIKYYCKNCHKLLGKDAYNGKGRCNPCSTKHQFLTLGIPKNKSIEYKNIWMRSTWEVAYAKYLIKNKIKWQYESKTFDLGNTTYTPDFYLPESDTYVEIKGYWRKDAKKKIKLFRKIFNKITLRIYNEKSLKKLGIL